jgi:hypothetical protein
MVINLCLSSLDCEDTAQVKICSKYRNMCRLGRMLGHTENFDNKCHMKVVWIQQDYLLEQFTMWEVIFTAYIFLFSFSYKPRSP